ncbi:MAG: YcxB family protein [Anaerovoracaceae bacterium]
MLDSIVFESQITQSDFQMLQHFYMYKKTPKMQHTLYLLFGGSLSMILIHFFSAIKWPIVIFDIFIVIALVTGFALTLVKSKVRKMTNPAKTMVGLEQKAIMDRDDYLVIEWSDTPDPLLYDWKEFYVWYEVDTHYFIFLSRELALIIPKRDSTKEMQERATARLREMLGEEGVANKKNSQSMHTM